MLTAYKNTNIYIYIYIYTYIHIYILHVWSPSRLVAALMWATCTPSTLANADPQGNGTAWKGERFSLEDSWCFWRKLKETHYFSSGKRFWEAGHDPPHQGGMGRRETGNDFHSRIHGVFWRQFKNTLYFSSGKHFFAKSQIWGVEKSCRETGVARASCFKNH